MAAVWGLDIGKSALKAVKLRPTNEGLEILAVEYIRYPIEDDEDERNEQVADAMRQFMAKHKGVARDSVVVGLAGLHAFSRFINLPPVEKSKVAQLVRLEAQQQIPFPIGEVNWDFVRLPQEDPDEEIEVGIFATRTELVDGFLADMHEANIRPDIVTIAPLAIYNFIRANGEDEEGAAIILDIGAEHTDLVIVDGERFWIRNLRIAGNDITKALAERFKVPFAEAEKLKRSSSKSAQAKKIFGTMEPVLKDLVGEIHRSVGFFKSQADGLSVKRMVLMGDGAKLKNLPKFLRQQLRYKVSRVQQLAEDRFVIDPDVDLDILKKHLLGFGVAMGLAVQGANQSHCAINLAPQQVQVQAQLRSKVPFAAGAAVCAWAAFGLGYMQQTSALAAVEAAQKETEAPFIRQIQPLQEEVLALKDLSAVEQQANAYNALGEGRTLALELLDAIKGVMPSDNAKLPSWDHKAHQSEDLDSQLQSFDALVRRENTHTEKMWLLSFEVKSQDDPERPNAYQVEMIVARPVSRGKENHLDDVRASIGRDFVKPLINRLNKEPFHVRDLDSQTYGDKGSYLGVLTEIFALHPDERNDDGGPQSFHCIMVPIGLEIGVPEPPPPPAPAPEGEGEGFGEGEGEGEGF
jgi:type IV pilus assembly protein PilM